MILIFGLVLSLSLLLPFVVIVVIIPHPRCGVVRF